MPVQRIPNLGQIGLSADVAPTLLPDNVCTDLVNVIPEDNSLKTVRGNYKLFDLDIEPLYHTAWRDYTLGPGNERQWIVVSDGSRVIAYHLAPDGFLTIEEITPTDDDTETGIKEPWTGGFVTFVDLNGVLVVNSESDGPFYWPGPATADVLPLVKLPGWDSTWRCRSMAAHRYCLFALHMVEGGNHYPYKLRWTNSAAEGYIPTEWVATASNDAGDDLLGETAGAIVGAARVRGQLFIIKEDAIYRARRVDGQYIYAIERLQGTTGTNAPRGWAEVQGALALFTSTDVLVFDGQRQSSLSDGIVRNAIFKNLSEQFWERNQLYYHGPSELLFVAGVTTGDRLTQAHIYNPNTRTWGHRTLLNSYGFDTAYLKLNLNVPTWNEFPEPTNPDVRARQPRWNVNGRWEDQTDGTWNKGVYQPSVPDIIVYESNNKPANNGGEFWVSFIYGVRPVEWDGATKNCVAQRVGIPINSVPGLAQITEVWFEMEGQEPVQFQVGAQETEQGPITWSPIYEGIPLRNVHLDPRLTGRFISWKISSKNGSYWKLSGLTFRWESAGER